MTTAQYKTVSRSFLADQWNRLISRITVLQLTTAPSKNGPKHSKIQNITQVKGAISAAFWHNILTQIMPKWLPLHTKPTKCKIRPCPTHTRTHIHTHGKHCLWHCVPFSNVPHLPFLFTAHRSTSLNLQRYSGITFTSWHLQLRKRFEHLKYIQHAVFFFINLNSLRASRQEFHRNDLG